MSGVPRLVLDPPYFKRLARPGVARITREQFLELCRLERAARGLPENAENVELWLFLDFLKRRKGGAA